MNFYPKLQCFTRKLSVLKAISCTLAFLLSTGDLINAGQWRLHCVRRSLFTDVHILIFLIISRQPAWKFRHNTEISWYCSFVSASALQLWGKGWRGEWLQLCFRILTEVKPLSCSWTAVELIFRFWTAIRLPPAPRVSWLQQPLTPAPLRIRSKAPLMQLDCSWAHLNRKNRKKCWIRIKSTTSYPTNSSRPYMSNFK